MDYDMTISKLFGLIHACYSMGLLSEENYDLACEIVKEAGLGHLVEVD